MRHRHLLLLVSLLPVCLLAASCATAHRGWSGSRSAAAPSAHCRSGAISRVGSSSVALAAVVRTHARVYRRPGRKPFASFRRLNRNQYPTIFRVLAAVRRRDCRATWYRVQLPVRPNGVTGFVRASAVGVGRVRTRIRVDVSARRLTLFRNGRPVLRTTVAVGSHATPTPMGSYYVNQRLIPANTSGPYGPGALGISAYSNVLHNWAQGGPVAIHGTNEPSSIGHAASNGCIRVRNQVLRRLFAATPAGTPVTITE